MIPLVACPTVGAKSRGGFNDISICDGKEMRDKATMALARDWITSMRRHANPYVLLLLFLLLDHRIGLQMVLLELFFGGAGLNCQAGLRRAIYQ